MGRIGQTQEPEGRRGWGWRSRGWKQGRRRVDVQQGGVVWKKTVAQAGGRNAKEDLQVNSDRAEGK